MTKEQIEHRKKHHRGSSSPDGAEQIYHNWLQRGGPTKVTHEQSEKQDRTTPLPDVETDAGSRSDNEERSQDTDAANAEKI